MNSKTAEITLVDPLSTKIYWYKSSQTDEPFSAFIDKNGTFPGICFKKN
jgi:hypothetical protein